ncbi:hypothetical protein D3C76_543630 [compost metagenome]
MAGPIDYLGAMPQVNLGQSLLSGLQAGAALREVKDRNLAEDRAAQYSADLQNTFANPTAQNFAALRLKYPEQSEAIGQGWKDLSEAQKGEEFGSGIRVYQALKNNNPDAANRVLDEQITAMENSGQDATDLRNIKDSIARDPRATSNQVAFYLSSVDPDRWKKMMDEQRTAEAAPYELSEKQSKAQKAAVDSKYAESKAAQDLAKGGWDIAKLQNDINVSRQNTAIAAMNASLAREQNDLKRQELQQKIDDAQAKRDMATNELAANIESGRSSIDNMLSTADRVLQTPAGVVESATGPISSKLPTASQDTADFEELVNTLGSQAFMAQIPNLKGMGALSNAEGEKLQSSLQNLSLRQSRSQLLQNVQESQRLMKKARENLARRYGVPETIPDRPTKAEPQGAPQGFRVLGVEGQ